MHETGFLVNEDRGSRIGDETQGLLPVATTKQEIENKGNIWFIQSGSPIYSVCSTVVNIYTF